MVIPVKAMGIGSLDGQMPCQCMEDKCGFYGGSVCPVPFKKGFTGTAKIDPDLLELLKKAGVVGEKACY